MVSPALTLEQFLHAIPKVELHCHLFGTVRQRTFEALNVAAGRPLSDEEITGFYTRGEKPVGVLRVLRALDAELVRTPDDLYRMTIEYLEDAAAHHVRHAEFSWNPTGTVDDSGIAYPRAQDAIVQAIRDADRQFGIQARLIAAIDREASPEAAVEMVEWVAAHRCEEVVGPTARTVRDGLRAGAALRPQDHGPCRRVRYAVDQRAHGARCVEGRPHRPWLHRRGRAGVRAGMRRARRALHGRADQLLLPAHIAARAVGAGPPDTAHAGAGAAHPSEHG
jgi:hypothetical protein